MNTNRPILVTGSPRSGTSWVGRIIGQEPFIHYVHEPFNISSNPCLCGVQFGYWFWYLSRENYKEYKEHLDHTIFPAYTWVGLRNTVVEMARSRRIRPLSRYLKSHLARRVVVKDPLAVFSAETLAGLYEMDVVILVRHPAAIVNSYKELNWTHPFSHFIKQPQLMDELPVAFRQEIEDFASNDHDIVDQAALLWKLIHSRIMTYQEAQPNWTILRYEDLALEPVTGFNRMFNDLRLPFSKDCQARIESHRLPAPLTDTMDHYSINQNPEAVMSKWKKNLSVKEVTRIRKRVEDISQCFYSDHDWAGILAALLFVYQDFISTLVRRMFIEPLNPENQTTVWADRLAGIGAAVFPF